MNVPSTHSRPTHAALGLILGAALLGATTAQAQHGGSHLDIGSRVESMGKQFDLTPDQQAQVRAILEQTRQEQLRLRQESRARIEALLTEEQKARRAERQLRSVDHQVERLTARLNLTPKQADQLKALFNEQRRTHALTRAQMRERMSSILTTEQLAKLDQGRRRSNRRSD